MSGTKIEPKPTGALPDPADWPNMELGDAEMGRAEHAVQSGKLQIKERGDTVVIRARDDAALMSSHTAEWKQALMAIGALVGAEKTVLLDGRVAQEHKMLIHQIGAAVAVTFGERGRILTSPEMVAGVQEALLCSGIRHPERSVFNALEDALARTTR